VEVDEVEPAATGADRYRQVMDFIAATGGDVA